MDRRKIDDVAAQAFSSCFYTNMFKGKTFGDAVRAARLETLTDIQRDYPEACFDNKDRAGLNSFSR